MLDFLKYMPLMFRLLNLLPKILEARKMGTPIIELLQTYSPDIIDLLKSIGGQLFPSLPTASQVEVGALISFDHTEVRWIQESLNKLGLTSPPLIVDGLYGGETKKAVEKFQTAHGVSIVDGWAGQVTHTAIQNELNKLPSPIITRSAI